MYQYKPEECDVVDKDRLRRYREKRSEWINWLRGGDTHSIWTQISSLLWNDVLFRTINDLRREGEEHPTPDVGFNHSVLRLFDVGFVYTQVLAIRRLTEHQPRDPNKGVISLRRLISDIGLHRELMTREVYVAYDGLPYDPEPLKNAHFEKILASGLTVHVGSLPTKGPEAWNTSEMVHENFDRLMKNTENVRSRNDLISPDWIDFLNSRLDNCQDTRKFTDKFVAHAAEPTNRAHLTPTQTGVTLDRLAECYHAIYQVAAFVFGPLLWEGSYGAVPVPQYDHLENLEKGWVTKRRKEMAREFWNRNLKSIEKWESESLWPDQEREK